MTAVLHDWRNAPVNQRVRAALGFLEKLTLTPEKVAHTDIVMLKKAGINEAGIREAVYVCFLFSVLDRLADAFDFELPLPGGFEQNARALLLHGYGNSSLSG